MTPRRRLNEPPKPRRHASHNFGYVWYLGKQCRLAGTWDSEEMWTDYRRWLVAEWGQTPQTAGHVTIATLCAAYLSRSLDYYRKPDGTHSSQIHIVRAAINGLMALYAETDVREFTPDKLLVMQRYWIAEGVTRGTVNKYAGQVRRIFKWGVPNGYVDHAVYQALTTVQDVAYGRSAAPEGDGRRIVAWAHVEATLPHLPQVIADALRLMYSTGARPAEVLQLRRQDIDTTGAIWHGIPEAHKESHKQHPRVLCFNSAAQAVLKPYLLRAPYEYLFQPREARGYSDKRWKSYYDKDALNRAVKAAIARANVDRGPHDQIPEWSPYQIRHTVATELDRLYPGESERVGMFLGHKPASVTARWYIEHGTEVADEIAQKRGV